MSGVRYCGTFAASGTPKFSSPGIVLHPPSQAGEKTLGRMQMLTGTSGTNSSTFAETAPPTLFLALMIETQALLLAEPPSLTVKTPERPPSGSTQRVGCPLSCCTSCCSVPGLA